MKIVVFDIDGTLTATNRVDGECFWAAVQGVLDAGSEPDWSDFVEVTDSSILTELCERAGRGDHAAIDDEVQASFMGNMQAAAAKDPSAFRAIAGAEQVLEHVRQAGWTPTLATGAWRRSAEFKLDLAGIARPGVPLVTASEFPGRVDIIRDAIRQVDPEGKATEVVLVGDAHWDLRAAKELGIGLVGRAEGDMARSLVEGGAAAAVPDFSDRASLMSAMEMALVSKAS